MDSQTIVVPTGGCTLPHLSSRSPASYSAAHGLLSRRRPRLVEQSLANTVKHGSLELLAGGACITDVRGLKKEVPKLVATGCANSFYGRNHGAAQRKAEFPLNSQKPLASADAKQGNRESYFIRNDHRERYRGDRDVQAGDSRLHGADYRSIGRSVPDDPSWPDPQKRSYAPGQVPQSTAKYRAPDGRDVECVERGGEESMEGRLQDTGAGLLSQANDLGVIDTGQENSRHPLLSIPRHELMKIEELRFSGDLREGDSGPQVLNLQRALFWLGHLPGLSLTGYFGPETARALLEFHAVHGVPGPCVWSAHSHLALRQHLQLESYGKESVEKSGGGVPAKSRPHVSKTWLRAKNISGMMMKRGLHSRQAAQLWCSKALPELVASVSSAPQLTSVTGRIGLVLLGVVVLSSIAKVWLTFSRRSQGQPVRRRAMSWRSYISRRETSRNTLRTPSEVLRVPSKSTGNGGFMVRRRSRMRTLTTEQQVENNNLLDRLVLFEGHVLRADSPNDGKTSMTVSSGLDGLGQKSADAASGPSVWNKSSLMSPTKQFQQPGLDVEQQNAVYKLKRLEKLEADPPRKCQLLPQQGNSFGITGREPNPAFRAYADDPQRPEFATWISSFLSAMFPDKEKRKPAFRRPFKQSNLTAKIRTPERGVFSDGESSSGSDKVELEQVPMEEGIVSRGQDDNESDLKKLVEELHKTVQSAEQTRVAAMRALVEEKMRTLELEMKITRQKEAAASLEEEMRVLKESHDALLASLGNKYSSPAGARAAAALLYQNWDSSDSSSARF